MSEIEELKSRLSQTEQRATVLLSERNYFKSLADGIEKARGEMEAQLAQMTKERDAAILELSQVSRECGRQEARIENYEKTFRNMLDNCDFFKKSRDEAVAQLAAARVLERAVVYYIDANQKHCEVGPGCREGSPGGVCAICSICFALKALSAAPLAPPVDRYRKALELLEKIRLQHKRVHKVSGPDMMCGFCQEIQDVVIEALAHPSEGGKEADNG